MNSVQEFIRNFGTNLELAKEVNEFFQARQDLINQHPVENLRIIMQLDSKENTQILTWLYFHLLSNKSAFAKYQNTPQAGLVDRRTLLAMLAEFFQNFNPQAALDLIPSKFYHLASLYSDYVLHGQEPILGIKSLLTAIEKLWAHQNSNGSQTEDSPYQHQVLGSLQKEFTKLCLKAKCYQHALKVIEYPTVSFAKYTEPMDVVSYLYYKGLIYTGLKRYADAIEQFGLVLSYPANCVHKVHTEAYKKLILLTLIQVAEGHIPISQASSHVSQIIPKNTSAALKYKLEASFQTYQSLAEAFINRERPQTFEELIILKQEEFQRDQNIGLLKKLIKVYRQPLRLRMVELSDTYLTLKLSEINTSSYSQHHQDQSQAEPLTTTLFQMIADGEIKAKIDAKQRMISFIDEHQGGDYQGGGEYLQVVEELEKQNKKIIQLMKRAQSVDKSIRTSKQYIKRDLQGLSGPGIGPGGAMAGAGGGGMMMMQ